jgi:hypothetical protein
MRENLRAFSFVLIVIGLAASFFYAKSVLADGNFGAYSVSVTAGSETFMKGGGNGAQTVYANFTPVSTSVNNGPSLSITIIWKASPCPAGFACWWTENGLPTSQTSNLIQSYDGFNRETPHFNLRVTDSTQLVPGNQAISFTVAECSGQVVGGTPTPFCGPCARGSCAPTQTVTRTITVVAPAVMSGTLTPAAASCVIAQGASNCTINYSWTTTNPVATSAVTSDTTNAGVAVPNTTVASGNTGTTVAFVVPYGGRNFYLYNNNVLLAQSAVAATSVTCAAGTLWDTITSKCVVIPPVPTNVVASCSADGQTFNMSWTRPAGYATSYVRFYDETLKTPVFYSDNLYPTISYSSVTIPGHIYSYWVHTGTANPGIYSPEVPFPLRSATVNCLNSSMFGTLIPATGSCVILLGASSCKIPFNWTTTNPVLTSAVTSPYPAADTHVSVPDANNGTNVLFTIPFASSPRSFFLYNNAILLAQSTVTSSCIINTGWNGTACVPFVDGTCSSPQTHYSCLSGTSANNINGASNWTWDCTGSGGGSTASCSQSKTPGVTLTATPSTIVSGKSTTLDWNGGGVNCSGTNFSTVGAAFGSISVSPTSTVTYSVTCGGESASATVTVKPKPIFIEP